MAIAADAHPATLTLGVRSPAELTRFYRDVLGLTVHEETSERVLLGGGVPFLALEPADPSVTVRPATGLFHVALLYPERARLADALARLAAARYPLQGAADHGVSEALYLADPEGNGIELYRDRSRAEWPFQGGALQMVTDPLDVQALLREGDADAPPPPTVGIGHMHLRVSDLLAAEEFYMEGVGLERMQRWRSEASFLAAGGYHHHLGINTWSSLGLPQPHAGAPGLRAWTMQVGAADELERLAQRLDALGWPFARDGESVQVREPAGSVLQVTTRGPFA